MTGKVGYNNISRIRGLRKAHWPCLWHLWMGSGWVMQGIIISGMPRLFLKPICPGWNIWSCTMCILRKISHVRSGSPPNFKLPLWNTFVFYISFSNSIKIHSCQCFSKQVVQYSHLMNLFAYSSIFLLPSTMYFLSPIQEGTRRKISSTKTKAVYPIQNCAEKFLLSKMIVLTLLFN